MLEKVWFNGVKIILTRMFLAVKESLKVKVNSNVLTSIPCYSTQSLSNMNYDLYSLLDDCKSSFDCEAGAYCTFDGSDVGACTYCSELGNKKCKDAGFIDSDDEDECKLECEGNIYVF